MKQKIAILMAAWLITSASLHADVSYLLIQGPFGSGGATESYKWQVDYPTGSLITGQDLLDSIFGTPVADGAVQNDPDFGGYPYFTSTSPTNPGFGATYASFGPGDYFALSFTINSITIDTNDLTSATSPSPGGTSTTGWNYYVAGGNGNGAIFTPPGTFSYGAYPAGEWGFSNDAADTRFLSNDSFDGWIYGDTGLNSDFLPATSGSTTAVIDDSSNSDDPLDFSNNGANDFLAVVNVPEPAAPVLLCGALAVIAFRRRKGGA
jgi:hypothetical protein